MKVREGFMEVGLAMMKGKRNYIEDAALVDARLPGQPNVRVQAVFDGHTGSEAAHFLAVNLQPTLAEVGSISPDSLTEACERLEMKLREAVRRSGSTAVIAVIEVVSERRPVLVRGREIIPEKDTGFKTLREKHRPTEKRLPQRKVTLGTEEAPVRVLVANVGDSRGLILTGEDYVELTKDHIPVDEERARVEAAGGRVQETGGVSRVRGLMMTRSFGDFAKKAPRVEPAIISTPEIRQFFMQWHDAMVLFSDGLVDGKLDWESVAFIVARELRDGISIRLAADELVQKAYGSGSTDNMTALVTRVHRKPRKPKAKVVTSIGPAESETKEDWSFKIKEGESMSLPMF
ncbi:protein phosphatase 2C domain-containing protein [Besnoitia besnoiti]|uniref:Protein phosphatase 2C domain-containing protein n=1 Tax=Besnoitia besnoiti TaxID=94643 RepID=A0A2A9MBI1_BESBE|nr:protein phosphatase 2C domain-containing protein [Besnoitia besnoiti]PFH32750.1 protein phosphatase 2C domain-containing protein [Besnoitia besnoiti]